MKQLVTQISSFLDSYESAPSAWVLVKSFHDNIEMTSDADCSMAYERSEGVNDSERDVMLNNLTSDQLIQLAALVIELSLEKLDDID